MLNILRKDFQGNRKVVLRNEVYRKSGNLLVADVIRDADTIVRYANGRLAHREDDLSILSDFVELHCYKAYGLRGGKGGFGTQLKSNARRNVGADISSCKSLATGRSLRSEANAKRIEEWRRRLKEGKSVVNTNSSKVSEKKGIGFCEDYKKQGYCLRGDLCSFAHTKDEQSLTVGTMIERRRSKKRVKSEGNYVNVYKRATEANKINLMDSVKLGLAKKNIKKRNKNESIQLLCGEAYIEGSCRIEAASAFPSLVVDKFALLRGNFYFECEIVNPGVFQVGFVTNKFMPDENNGTGVGDIKNSFAYGPKRNIVFLGGEELKGSAENNLKRGTIVGCFIELDKHFIVYSIDGSVLNDSYMNFESNEVLFPAISLELETCVELKFDNLQYDNISQFYKDFSKTKKPDVDLVDTKKKETETSASQVIIDLMKYPTYIHLQKDLSNDQITQQLRLRGAKSAGAPPDRVKRLFSLRGLTEVPKNLRAKRKKSGN
jgi:hypothetical protein